MKRSTFGAAVAALIAACATASCGLLAGLDEIHVQQGSGGSGGSEPGRCDDDGQCDDGDPCTVDACSSDGLCAHTPAADGAAPDGAQIAGDCKTIHCVAGEATTEDDDADVPDDHEACTIDSCEGGAVSHAPVAAGTACVDAMGLAGSCDGAGQCKVVCSDAMPCPDPGPCAMVACDVATGTCVVTPLPDGSDTPGVAQIAGDCHKRLCKQGKDVDQIDDSDVPSTATDCDDEACDQGAPSNPPKTLDTPCSTAPSGPGFCDGASACVECNNDGECPGPVTDCAHPSCMSHACGAFFVADGTPISMQIMGDCKQIQCNGAGAQKIAIDDNDKPVDGKECTTDACSSGVPSNPPLPAGVACNGGMFVCNAVGDCGCQSNGDCAAPNTCGGAGVQNVCGCTPSTCVALGKTCGTTSDLCFNPALNCNTNTKNGGETDVDCGGPITGCATRCAAGKTCSAGADCASGFCVDGVCCNNACPGTCQACSALKKGQGPDGVCGSIKAGTDPDAECNLTAASTCGTDGSCDGAGACEKWVAGTPCLAAFCQGNTLNKADLCNGTGTCADSGQVSCVPYVCANGACPTTCANDAGCTNGNYCTGASTCAAKKANGVACAGPNECTNGNCVDGVCCNTPCQSTCQACSAAKKGGGADGTCGSIAAGTDPDNECTQSAPSTCGTDGSCNGSGSCEKWPGGTVCAAQSCSGSTQTNASVCTGGGSCNSGNSFNCDPYVCGASACLTMCSSDAHCTSGNFCNGSSCVSKKSFGSACAGSNECNSGSCVDGVCCTSSCTGTCSACSNAKKGSGPDGFCGQINYGLDPDLECGTYSCSGSSFCNSSCGSDTDCNVTGYCDMAFGVCFPKQPTGGFCSTHHECVSGFCLANSKCA